VSGHIALTGLGPPPPAASSQAAGTTDAGHSPGPSFAGEIPGKAIPKETSLTPDQGPTSEVLTSPTTLAGRRSPDGGCGTGQVRHIEQIDLYTVNQSAIVD
jgi:hypothetical protein